MAEGDKEDIDRARAAVWRAFDGQIAAHVLEAAVEDNEFERGRFVIADTDRFVKIIGSGGAIETRRRVSRRRAGSLDVQTVMESVLAAFPNGCHIPEVEIDHETGVVTVVKYSMVNDFGVIVNPLLVEGKRMALSCKASAKR